jgi:hypothetical protein
MVKSPSNAKDFKRFPQLLDSHVERLKQAREAANYYLNDTLILTTGLITYENFLHHLYPERIAKEIEAIRPGDAKRFESLVTTDRDNFSYRASLEMLPIIKGLFKKHHYEVITKFWRNLYRQHLYNTPDDNDKQKVLHSDTFFPAIKWWYFPRAVKEWDGPLVYVPNSPILTPELLAWHELQIENIRKGKVEEWRGHGHFEGSLRINEEELKGLGLKAKPVTVGANTLIIANVFGFHRRGDTKQPTHRFSLHGSIRVDNPL